METRTDGIIVDVNGGGEQKRLYLGEYLCQ